MPYHLKIFIFVQVIEDDIVTINQNSQKLFLLMLERIDLSYIHLHIYPCIYSKFYCRNKQNSFFSTQRNSHFFTLSIQKLITGYLLFKFQYPYLTLHIAKSIVLYTTKQMKITFLCSAIQIVSIYKILSCVQLQLIIETILYRFIELLSKNYVVSDLVRVKEFRILRRNLKSFDLLPYIGSIGFFSSEKK